MAQACRGSTAAGILLLLCAGHLQLTVPRWPAATRRLVKAGLRRASMRGMVNQPVLS